MTTEERIVYATAPDGVELEGLLIVPKKAAAESGCLTVWVHTRQSHFTARAYVTIGRLVAERGWPFLSVNTRGHDFGAWRSEHGPVLAGDRQPRARVLRRDRS